MSNWRSCVLPLGSPMEPVAPPASGDGMVAQQLEPAQRQQRHEVADVQAVGGRVKAAVEGDGAGADAFRQLLRVGAIGQQAAPLEFFQNVHGGRESYCSHGWKALLWPVSN